MNEGVCEKHGFWMHPVFATCPECEFIGHLKQNATHVKYLIDHVYNTDAKEECIKALEHYNKAIELMDVDKNVKIKNYVCELHGIWDNDKFEECPQCVIIQEFHKNNNER